jgi:predicted DCC family thiol-disulfide oxidoreductase YuxK
MTQHAPARPIVVYDGECPYCRKQVGKMKRHDVDEVFDYVPRQTEDLEQRFPKLAEGDFNTGLRLIETDGTIFVASDAIYHIARRLRGWRNWTWLYRVPGLKQLLRAIYAWIARNRSKLGPCTDERCDIG